MSFSITWLGFLNKVPLYPRGCSFLPDRLGMTWHGSAHTCNDVMLRAVRIHLNVLERWEPRQLQLLIYQFTGCAASWLLCIISDTHASLFLQESPKRVVTYVGVINHVAPASLIGMLAINKGRELTFKKHELLARRRKAGLGHCNYIK